MTRDELAERVAQLGKRKYDFDQPIAEVLRRCSPIGMTGHNWSDREAFDQAIALVKLAPDIVAALRTRSTQEGDKG